jgi:hypothetical protein
VDEKRLFHRYPTALWAAFRVGGEAFRGQLINVSAGGGFLVTDVLPSCGARMQIAVRTGENLPSIWLDLRVVWSRDQLTEPDDQFGFAGYWLHASSKYGEERLREFLSEVLGVTQPIIRPMTPPAGGDTVHVYRFPDTYEGPGVEEFPWSVPRALVEPGSSKRVRRVSTRPPEESGVPPAAVLAEAPPPHAMTADTEVSTFTFGPGEQQSDAIAVDLLDGLEQQGEQEASDEPSTSALSAGEAAALVDSLAPIEPAEFVEPLSSPGRDEEASPVEPADATSPPRGFFEPTEPVEPSLAVLPEEEGADSAVSPSSDVIAPPEPRSETSGLSGLIKKLSGVRRRGASQSGVTRGSSASIQVTLGEGDTRIRCRLEKKWESVLLQRISRTALIVAVPVELVPDLWTRLEFEIPLSSGRKAKSVTVYATLSRVKESADGLSLFCKVERVIEHGNTGGFSSFVAAYNTESAA